MLVKISSVAFNGLEVLPVDVEVSVVSRGFPNFDIVGLPAKSIDESRHRIRSAFANTNLEFPSKKITTNLAPADIHKTGAFYDLPIAASILCASYNLSVPRDSLFFGELSLDGTLRHTKGALLLALHAKEHGKKKIFIPIDCLNEVASVTGVEACGVRSLKHLALFLSGKGAIESPKRSKSPKEEKENTTPTDGSGEVLRFEDILGQQQAKRALEVSASGGHNILVAGPPGSGKSMLAKSLLSISAPLTSAESLEVTKIYSSMGKIPPGGSLVTARPFRSPHHTISYAGMLGGGSTPTPGEISLAHRGVLFMDEFSEFSRFVLEALRQPLEDGFVTVSRNRGSMKFPSRFTLVAASNLCPCGYYGSLGGKCTCGFRRVENYHKRFSGPLMDRIDLHVGIQPVLVEELGSFSLGDGAKRKSVPGDSSEVVLSRVLATRSVQEERFSGEGVCTNAEMSNNQVKKFCTLTPEARKILDLAVNKLDLSARSYFKTIKVSRTIADMEGGSCINVNHISEALQYRSNVLGLLI